MKHNVIQKLLILCLAAMLPGTTCLAQFQGRFQRYQPASTFKYAQRDLLELFLDVYDPAPGSQTALGGVEKPAILFMFGGGFMSGSRSDFGNLSWFRRLNEEGYRVIAIDYRLGLKGVKPASLKFISQVYSAIDMAVKDLYAATAYILEHAAQLGVRPDGIVLAGSSAGAISVLQGEWELCNGFEAAKVLPQGFNYAGVISFSGAIYSKEGGIRYRDMEPCPHMLCHGTADRIVTYRKLRFMNLNFAGTKTIAKTFIRKGYNYRILRFQDNMHEIAGAQMHLFDQTIDFLENNVVRGISYQSDALISDPEIQTPAWASGRASSLYK